MKLFDVGFNDDQFDYTFFVQLKICFFFYKFVYKRYDTTVILQINAMHICNE